MRDPYWIEARVDCECPCGAHIAKGGTVLWFPKFDGVECCDCGAKTQGMLDDDDMNQRTHAM